MSSAPEVILDDVIAALQNSHTRLRSALGALTSDELVGPSYDDEWTIAQVASHLGSGAEIFGLFLDAGLRDEAVPDRETFQEIWARWDAKPATEQTADAITVDRQLLDNVAAIPAEQRESWRLDMFGTVHSLPTFLRTRLAEHALHSWDIAVMRDPRAVIAPDATALIVDNLGQIAQRAGKNAGYAGVVAVETAEPARNFALTLSADGAQLIPSASAADDGTTAAPAATATLRLPAEAFVRLVYGRLDDHHTPPGVDVDRIELDALRAAFPGV